MNRSKRIAVGLFCAVFLLFALPFSALRVSAQGGATLDVTVLDPQQTAVSGASVVLHPLSPEGPERTADATGNGHYHVDAPPGRYRLTVSHPSLRRFEQEVTLIAGPNRELQITLQLEPLSQYVLVSADALPVTAASAGETATIITRQEIDQRQATAVAPLLATVPGFTLAQTGREGGPTSLFLNGGNSSYTKVLLDGIPLNEPGGAADFSNYTLDNIEKVEVVEGAQSALFGSDAMSGVVQLLTHRGDTNVPRLTLLGEGGTFSTGRGTAQLSGLAGRFDYSAAAAYFGTAGQGPNNQFLNRTLSGNFGWRFSDTNTLRLIARNNASDAGVAGQTLLAPPNLVQHNALHNFSSGLQWDFQSGAHWLYHMAATESYIHQEYVFAAPPAAPAVNQLNRAGFVGQTSYAFRDGGITAGYQYEVENGWVGGPHFRRNNQAGFLDGRWLPTARLSLNAGFRVEDNASFGVRGVPRASAAYLLRTGGNRWGATRLRFSFGLGIKEPSLLQSFSTNPFFLGNPALRPERSRTFNGGVEQQFLSDRLRVAINYFDNRFHDIISFGAGTFFNTDLARARGLNVTSEARPLHWLQLSGSYSYDASLVLESPNAFDAASIAGNRLLRRPVHSGTVIVNTTFARMNFNLSSYLSGERTDSTFLAPGVTSNPGYARFDLAGSRAIRSGVSVFGRVENLTNKSYQEALGFPALGRDFRLGMKFTFGGE